MKRESILFWISLEVVLSLWICIVSLQHLPPSQCFGLYDQKIVMRTKSIAQHFQAPENVVRQIIAYELGKI